MPRRFFRPFLLPLLVGVLPFLGGCQSLGYYTHLAQGQWQVLRVREPVAELLLADSTAPQLRARLGYAAAVLRFAREELHLPVGDTYSTYADLGRSRALWAVYAAPRLSTEALQWCFPVAGCSPYRGYFQQEQAEAFARELAGQGHDTYVAPVRAYSTLGWFSDPLLNTFLFDDDISLAALLFHELAHKVAFVPGDASFNEGLATFVEREGIRRWMKHLGRTELLAEQSDRQAARNRFVALVASTREKLRDVYSSDLTREEKAARKMDELRQLQARFRRASASMPALSRYAGWIASGLNNAKLATVSTYHDRVPEFARIFREIGDFSKFYATCRELAELDTAERAARMQRQEYTARQTADSKRQDDTSR